MGSSAFAGIHGRRRFLVQGKSESRSGLLQWVVVLVVGIVVVTLVLGLGLIPRLNDGQKVLDSARPAFAPERVAGARAGIDFISTNVDMADPLVTPQGAASEVPKLIAFVSQKTGLSQAQVVSALKKTFPHTTALLLAIPLSAVTAEQPALLAFLEKSLHVSQAELLAALKTSFPALAQAIVNLPTVTAGWDRVQKISGTNFGGAPMQSMPDVSNYFSLDVIPVLEKQRGHYDELVSTSTIDFIGWLVLAIGIIVIVYGVLMLLLARRLEPGPGRTGHSASSADAAASPA
jgi:hypothetical protein